MNYCLKFPLKYALKNAKIFLNGIVRCKYVKSGFIKKKLIRM